MPRPVQALGRSLRCEIEQHDAVTRIALSGDLTDEADLTPLRSTPGAWVFDLGEISRINSIGVRNWIHFVRDCERAGRELTFERCSPAIVQQMSMILNFMGAHSRVSSVLVPYLCTQCTVEHLEVLEIAPGAAIRPSMPCPKCDALMELDELVETYRELLEHRA
jgi:anti-anti-sigma regulatory factor